MSQREEKIRKRARKKAEESKRLRERERKAASTPRRLLTNFARSIVNHFPETSRQRQQFEMNFQLFLLRVQRLPLADAWREALEHIAKAHRETQGRISCQRGCSGCCHQQVVLSPGEGIWIAEHLQKQPLELDEERLARQLKAAAWKDLSYGDRACVFLGPAGECRIYEVRPLTCRRYVVTSDPRHCENEATDQIQSTLNVECDAYLSAFITHHGHQTLVEFLGNLRTGS